VRQMARDETPPLCLLLAADGNRMAVPLGRLSPDADVVSHAAPQGIPFEVSRHMAGTPRVGRQVSCSGPAFPRHLLARRVRFADDR